MVEHAGSLPRRTIVRRVPSRLSNTALEKGRPAFLADADAVGGTPAVQVHVSIEGASDVIAEALGVAEGSPVVVRSRVMRLDGDPVQIATSYLPAAIAGNTPITQENPGAGGIYARLAEIGYGPKNFTETVRTRLPRHGEAELLKIPSGEPVFQLTRIAFTQHNQPVEFNIMVMPGQCYELVYQFSVSKSY